MNRIASKTSTAPWEVTVEGPDGRRTERYRAVLVANGHHWQPRWPEPAFPGAEDYEGEQLHVHHYREPDVLVGKRVLVLGIGNSAVDVAVESSRIAEKTFLAMRRGAWVLPKFLGGKPIDEAAPPVASYLPIPVQRFFFNRMLKTAVGEMTDYGLPEPDHRLLEAHPTVSSELLPRIGHGDIAVKPNIDRFAGGRTVRFADGSEEQVDLVVYCTGYRIEFPFLDQRVFAARDNRMPLYRRVVSVESPGLYFVGFIQPLGPIMPLAEAQAEWVADLLAGEAALPPAPEMREEIAEYDRWLKKRFVASKRHTIEVDFHPYLREIKRRGSGPERAGPSVGTRSFARSQVPRTGTALSLPAWASPPRGCDEDRGVCGASGAGGWGHRPNRLGSFQLRGTWRPTRPAIGRRDRDLQHDQEEENR